ncbi:hypothetical protein BN1708_013947, partial [Verticillium longisporum]
VAQRLVNLNMKFTPIILSAALVSAGVIPSEVRVDESRLAERSVAGDKCLTLECAKKEYVPVWRGKICEKPGCEKPKCKEPECKPKTDGYEEYYWIEHIDRKHRHKDNGYKDYYYKDQHDYPRNHTRPRVNVNRVITKRGIAAADEGDDEVPTKRGESAVGRPYFKPYYEDDPDYESHFEPKPAPVAAHPHHHHGPPPPWRHHHEGPPPPYHRGHHGHHHGHHHHDHPRHGCHPHDHHHHGPPCHRRDPAPAPTPAPTPGKKHDDRDDVQWYREEITHDHEEDRHQGKNSDKCIHCKPVIKAVNTTDTRAAANSAFSNRNGGARTLNNKSGNIIKAGSQKTVEVVPTFVEEDVAEEENDDEEKEE